MLIISFLLHLQKYNFIAHVKLRIKKTKLTITIQKVKKTQKITYTKYFKKL